MAIFGQIPRRELGTKYTHYGWYGLCPVYVGGEPSICPDVAERNWVPEWWMDFSHHLMGSYIWLRSAFDPEWEPAFVLLVGKRIQCTRP